MRIRIRSKVTAALAVPLVALVAIAGLRAVEANAEADRIEQETELAFVALGPGSVTTALQNERNWSSLELIGLSGATELEVESLEQAREETDVAVEALRARLGDLEPDVRAAFVPALESLDRLVEARDAFDGYDGDRDLSNSELANDVYDAYTAMIESFFDGTSTVATQIDEAALRNGVEIVDAASRRSEAIAAATRNIILDQLTGGDHLELRLEAIGLVDRLETANDRIDQLAVGAYADVAEETFALPSTTKSLELFGEYVSGEAVDIPELLANVSVQDVASIAERATDVLASEADDLSAAASDEARLFTLIAAGVVSLAILITYAATTSITRPLRKLRDEADAMAGHRLPDAVRSILETPLGDDVQIPELPPVEVKTRDEVGEVVSALNDVQQRTLALAADQAVLRRNIADSFVNLGRRNQNLLDRQLEFITELEQLETEPDQLEALFRLDHLATRMRRNAESLLVLAGTESPRQWGAPVGLDAVVRAGLGEVEDYRRVHLRNLDDAAVAGGAAAGLSHVVAELIENALQFSPPDEPVEVKGRRTHDGYVIAIADNGIGMPAEDLERANRRLSGQESYTVAPSKYLGHYVAGQLASRLGVGVRLQDNPAGGLVATVVIPPTLLEDPVVDLPTAPSVGEPEPAASAGPPEPTVDAVTAAGPDDAAFDAWFAQEVEAAERVGDPQERPAAEPERPTVAAEPASLDEALGGGRLERVDTVADLERAIHGDDVAPMPSAAPSGGLPRRVPGAQRPDAAPLPARIRRTEASAAEAAPPTEASASPEPASAGLFGFLAEFQSGAARATDPDAPQRSTEEER